ncbi:poly-gamma-glutamate hydrolase family protein [Schnuerera sp. xch1]|uniref:poly-gamma-glutamate hydrolase family protein n=1 Tax=Schnuerera sp. xch1 TaxID=2874283 RepID=UPI001CC1B189|nr:poly-gamma-glutamate hydrolase family protein [Schnuerera sp. xch1]MBZ2174629.1 poly-gamma-glutamate hydrolase family protein [Schnuerera sp. xch1]
MTKKHLKVLAFVLLFTLGIGASGYALTEGYTSFADLSAVEEAGQDYSIKTNDVGSDTTILAIHGGGIERGTSEIVEALGGHGKYNTYLFEGNKPSNNWSLFIKAINFDEPSAVNLVKKSADTVSVIGAADNDEITYVGGQNKILAELIKLHLTNKGYAVKNLSIPDRIAGVMNSNIVNKNKLFKDSYQMGGVQIAVSKGLRDKLVANSSELNNYSYSIHEALNNSWPIVMSQLEKMADSDGFAKSNGIMGFLNKFNPTKPNFDKKVDKILEKDAKTPDELIKNVEHTSIED